MTKKITVLAVLAALTITAFGAPPKAHRPVPKGATSVRFGKYLAELRIPDGGLNAGEELDLEFRVTDTTQKDPVESGFKGVGAIQATAEMSMPAMPGMPNATPNVHREGVPGDYGIEVFFPHGGEFQVDLLLQIPNDGTHKVSFIVPVQDERVNKTAPVQPFVLKVVDWPKSAKANEINTLKLKVVNSKTGAVQTLFDEAHTKNFHLLLLSKDLGWFLHEHPTMAPDGTWSVPIRFPAGTQYWVYGDVAPRGKGSRLLLTSVKVGGPKPTWSRKLVLTRQATDGNLKGVLSPLAPIQVGKSATLQIKLLDAKTGSPVTDTEEWLGAAGHLMIFHESGQTAVHSHPLENAENKRLVSRGIIRFSARFPRAGKYKAYAQFQWKGSVHTLPFALEVR